MNDFNDYVSHFLQLNQIQINNFNDCVYDFLELSQFKLIKFNDFMLFPAISSIKDERFQ